MEVEVVLQYQEEEGVEEVHLCTEVEEAVEHSSIKCETAWESFL